VFVLGGVNIKKDEKVIGLAAYPKRRIEIRSSCLENWSSSIKNYWLPTKLPKISLREEWCEHDNREKAAQPH